VHLTAPFPLLIALAALTIAGCSKKIAPVTATDTEGRTFDVTCTSPTACTLSSSATPKPTTPAPDGARPAFVLHQASRLYAVCEVWMQGTSSAVHLADCRPFACSSDTQCPPAKGMTQGACSGSFCIDPSAAIAPEDSVLLCLAGTGVPAGSTKQVERYALGNNCGNPCRVPRVCRQP